MSEPLTTAIETATAAVAALSDPIERFAAAKAVREQLDGGDSALKDLQQAVVRGLYDDWTGPDRRSFRAVGRLLGITAQRAEQLYKGRTG